MFAILIVSILAGEPLFKPTGKYAAVETVTPTKPAEQSDLHSHLCSNPRCRHEWWHDPRKGPVSHNCPKCGREQWAIHQSAPTGARSTSPPAASLQQVDRAPASDTPSKQRTVYVVGSTYCGACVAFHKKHGDGNEKTRYVYAQMDKSRPSDIPGTVWNEIVRHNNTLSFTWPFFVVERDGKFVASQARVE